MFMMLTSNKVQLLRHSQQASESPASQWSSSETLQMCVWGLSRLYDEWASEAPARVRLQQETKTPERLYDKRASEAPAGKQGSSTWASLQQAS